MFLSHMIRLQMPAAGGLAVAAAAMLLAAEPAAAQQPRSGYSTYRYGYNPGYYASSYNPTAGSPYPSKMWLPNTQGSSQFFYGSGQAASANRAPQTAYQPSYAERALAS